MERSQCDLVVSVCSKSGNLSKFSYVDKHGCLHPFAEATVENKYIRRQDLPCTYAENGAIFLQRVETVRHPPLHVPNSGSLQSSDIKAYVMPEERSLDIDTPFDLHVARLLMQTPLE